MSNVPEQKKPIINFECEHCGRSYDNTDVCTSDDCPDNEIAMPDLLNYWTVDEVAECLDGVGDDLYRKLWSYITAETDGNPPLAKVAWEALTHEEKAEMVQAVEQEFPDGD
ncbi:hypothetical protein [Klebsiella pneumoniae]|uniref:hypothetical protein n=1 Tax=Klebsiella pneumoniae TaxID=573 RepID=UPI002B1BDE0C|nr:hypothetical protein [Klebsiella pneumoniae]